MKPVDNKSDLNIQIYISMHKESFVPEGNSLLCPIQVGTALSDSRFDNMLHDDDGDNISVKNKRYCELTAQYYAWKNIDDADYYGFWHYRRYFCFNQSEKADSWGNIEVESLDSDTLKRLSLEENSMRNIISEYDVIVPNYWECNEGKGVMTVAEHWMKHFPAEDLRILTDVIDEIAPKYKKSLTNVLYGNSAPFCNMFIMKKELFEEYSEFCFGILEEIEKITDHRNYSVEQYRLLGHIAERLLAVFVDYIKSKKKGIRILTLPTVLVRDTTPLSVVRPVFEKMNRISIALACDNDYTPITGVLLESIKRNMSPEYYYDVVIMHRNISEANQDILCSIFYNCGNATLRFADVSRNFKEYINVHVDRHLSVETYYRFMIMDIFRDYDRVLYLDCDMIVEDDLSELFATDMGENAIAAVRDIDFISASVDDSTKKLYNEQILKYIKIPEIYDYFQAGVIIFNINKIKELISSEELFSIALSRDWYYHDQDVLNYVFSGSVKYLDYKWNVYSLLESDSARSNLIKNHLPALIYSAYCDARKKPAIIHFAGVPKPWKNLSCDLAMKFWKYAKTSPYYEFLCQKLNEDHFLPYGSVVFTSDYKYEDNYGAPLFDIKFVSQLWSESYALIDFIYLSDHFRKEICSSTLLISVSCIENADKQKEIRINHFVFGKSDYGYLLNDNIGYSVIDSSTVRVFGRNIAKNEGFSWRVRELQSREFEKPTVIAQSSGYKNANASLDNIRFSPDSFVMGTNNVGIKNLANNVYSVSDVVSENEFLKYRIGEIEKSFSYKLGFGLTAIPRWLRGLTHKD